MNPRPSGGPGAERPGPLARDDERDSWGPSWGLGRVLASSPITSPHHQPPHPPPAPTLPGLQPGIQAWPLPLLPRSAQVSSAQLARAQAAVCVQEAAQEAPPEGPHHLPLVLPHPLGPLHPPPVPTMVRTGTVIVAKGHIACLLCRTWFY